MLTWILLVILRDNRESSIEALQLATVNVMMSISDSNRFNQTKLRTMITLKLETSNAVFEGSEGFVASHIIQKCIKKLENFDTLENNTYIIRDINGNKIGTVETSSDQ